MARPRKPSADHEITGAYVKNPQRRNTKEPQYPLVADVSIPEWIEANEFAAAMWKKVCPMVVAQRVLTEVDTHALEGFCMAYARWREAEEEVSLYGVTIKKDNGDRYKNPAVNIANSASANMVKFSSLLGIDPSTRSKIVQSPVEDDDGGGFFTH